MSWLPAYRRRPESVIMNSTEEDQWSVGKCVGLHIGGIMSHGLYVTLSAFAELLTETGILWGSDLHLTE